MKLGLLVLRCLIFTPRAPNYTSVCYAGYFSSLLTSSSSSSDLSRSFSVPVYFPSFLLTSPFLTTLLSLLSFTFVLLRLVSALQVLECGLVNWTELVSIVRFCRSAASAHHSAIISLVCNDTLGENEALFDYIGTQNMPTDTYVSIICYHYCWDV